MKDYTDCRIWAHLPPRKIHLQMKHFFKWLHCEVRLDATVIKELRHLALPALVYVAPRHLGTGVFKVVGFEIAHKQAILAEKKGIVVPTRFSQSCEHLRPDRTM